MSSHYTEDRHYHDEQAYDIFRYSGVDQLWNKLPEAVVSASIVSAFISRLNSMRVSFFNVLF